VIDHPRLAPLPREQWDDDVRAAFAAGATPELAERYFTGETEVPAVLATMAHHPLLARAWLDYNAVLLRRPALPPRLRELVILRVAWRTRSTYEWAQHVRLGARYGITDDEVAAVGVGPGDVRWPALERDVLAATDQLLEHYAVDDATWTRLAESLDVRQLVELTFVVGSYACLAMAFNTFGLQLEPAVQALPIPPLPPSPLPPPPTDDLKETT